MGSFDGSVAVGPELIEAQVVGKDEDDVGLFGGRDSECESKENRDEFHEHGEFR